MKFNEKNSKFLIKLIAKHVEIIVFRVEDDLLDGQHVKLIIQVYFSIVFEVIVDAISESWNNDNILFFVHAEKFWLFF